MRTMREFKVKGPWYRKAYAIFNKIQYPIVSLPVLRQLLLSHPTFEDRMKYIAAEGFNQEQQAVMSDNTADSNKNIIPESTVDTQSELSQVNE